MNYKESAEYIDSLGMFSLPPTLSRMEKAVDLLHLKNTFPVIHIAGTNGKGSVAAYISASLKQAGYKTGLFISPHITDFCERISINGKNIDKSSFAKITEKIKNENLEYTEFEFLTLMALMYFGEKKIDVAVFETGLGGRLDATNIIDNKLVSVITKIGLDHTNVLGKTLTDIAKEKCGIIKGKTTVCAPFEESEALAVIKSKAENLFIPDTKDLKVLKSDFLGNAFIYKGEKYETSMPGKYQVENAICAIEVLKNCQLEISKENIKSGIKNAFMPARVQVVSKKPLIVIDGAHNPSGAKALCEIIKPLSPITAIVGVMKDKDYENLLKIALKYSAETYCVKACDYERALEAEELLKSARKFCKNSSAESLQNAIKKAKEKNRPVFIFGSLYLASEALKLF